MGFLSGLKKLSDAVGTLNQAAGEVSQTTLEDYGTPQYSLYTALQLGELHRRIDIKDEEGNLKYYTKSSIVAIKGKTDVLDPKGRVVAHLEKRPVSLHEKHFVTMADGRKFTLSNEILHIIKDITNIKGLGWQLRGNILGLNFELYDGNGDVIAVIGQKLISIHDKYCIDIYKPEYEEIIVAILITLQHMIRDRETYSGSSGGSSSSSN